MYIFLEKLRKQMIKNKKMKFMNILPLLDNYWDFGVDILCLCKKWDQTFVAYRVKVYTKYLFILLNINQLLLF